MVGGHFSSHYAVKRNLWISCNTFDKPLQKEFIAYYLFPFSYFFQAPLTAAVYNSKQRDDLQLQSSYRKRNIKLLIWKYFILREQQKNFLFENKNGLVADAKSIAW